MELRLSFVLSWWRWGQKNQVCSNDNLKEEFIKIVNYMYMTPRARVLVLECGHISHVVKMHNFFLKSFSPLSQALIRQTKYTVMMTKEGSTKILNFICHYSEYVLSSLSIYFTLIAIVLKDYDAAFLYHC